MSRPAASRDRGPEPAAEPPASPATQAGRRTAARSVAGWVLRLGIGAAILTFLFTFIPVADVVAGLSSAAPAWIGLALGLVAVERLMAAYRITILCNQAGIPLSAWQNLRISLAATFYGMFLPGELAGGAVRWYKMSRPNGKRAEAVAVLSFDRLVDTIVLVLAGLVFWFLEGPSMASSAVELGLLGLLGGLLVMLCLSLSRRASALFLIPLARLARRLRMSFVYASVEKVVTAVRGFGELRPGAIVAITTVSVVRQLLAIGILFAFASSLQAGAGFVTLGWVRTFMNIAVMLPVSISGLGIREGTLVLLLQPYGVPGSVAIALSLLMLFSHFVVAAAGGLFELKSVVARRRDERIQAQLGLET